MPDGAATAAQSLRILEVGAGIGGMAERLLVDVLTHATYTAIDKAPTLIAEAHRRLLTDHVDDCYRAGGTLSAFKKAVD